ncbi:MAG: right-handed parallel beta-helix repeat-containing protein [Chloroflexi bacterium]|nr:right-handed parallel beta-helix repeat-containing protein [Chloroflexota bacterium]
MKTRILQVLAVLAAALVLLLAVAALTPIPRDDHPGPEAYGAGASSVQPSLTGLLRAFPPINDMGNTSTPQKVELGRLLFFDPVLSEEDDLSCAHCHHPDYGFADGLPQALGRGGVGAGPERSGGVSLARNTPGLWNAAFTSALFWDGRVDSLEYQALVPLNHADEMAVANNEALAAELRAIPQYVALFDAAFGGGAESVTAENAVRALAAFERTLLSQNSPFDRYAAGDLQALTPAQRRGLTLFRSAALRCFECHSAPTFAGDTFRVIGVPDAPGLPHDEGRAAVVADGVDGAFKIPTLRNVALTAPYMHNGVFGTLEEVIAFYEKGGGRAEGRTDIDPFLQGFDLTEQEKADLIAFLYALTDESALPEIPASVPSGLPVVGPIPNFARDIAEDVNAGSGGGQPPSGGGRTLTVQPGQTIQEVVDQAAPGDTILIPHGVYYERIVIDLNGITLLGVPNDAGEYPILDGRGELSDAVISSGNDFEIGYLHVRDYTDNGVIAEGVTGVYMHHIVAENTGTYGLYPVQSTDVLIEESVVSGANDAGIYAGQSLNVVVRDNEVYENVLGIELENVVNGEVYGNYAHDNTNGILIVLLPQLTSKVSVNTVIYDNRVENNNHENFAKANTAASKMPPGSGIALIAADEVEVYANVISGNKTAGLGIFNLTIAFDTAEIDIGPRPENVYIHDNQFADNGYDADEFLTAMGIPGADILWDISGAGVRVDQPDAVAFPPVLPTSRWPAPAYTLYWNLMNWLIGLLG